MASKATRQKLSNCTRTAHYLRQEEQWGKSDEPSRSLILTQTSKNGQGAKDQAWNNFFVVEEIFFGLWRNSYSAEMRSTKLKFTEGLRVRWCKPISLAFPLEVLFICFEISFAVSPLLFLREVCSGAENKFVFVHVQFTSKSRSIPLSRQQFVRSRPFSFSPALLRNGKFFTAFLYLVLELKVK